MGPFLGWVWVGMGVTFLWLGAGESDLFFGWVCMGVGEWDLFLAGCG